MPNTTRLLIVTDMPDEIGALIDARFRDLPVRYLTDPARMEATLADFNPTVILAFPGEPVPKRQFPTLINHPSVRWISNGGAGVEHMGPWNPAEKIVTNASGVNAPFLAQYAIAAHVSANIGMHRYARQQQARHWERHEWQPFEGRRFCVVGLGNIGRAVAAHAKALGMHVVGTRGTARPTEHVDEVFAATDLLDALAGADFVSVHTAHTAETEGLINAAAFDAMADGAIFLNASRGPVVDESALLAALDSGKVSTAILDVFQTEPLPKDHPFWGHERVIVTPHMADSVSGWQINMTRAFCDNLERWVTDAPLENIVDPAKGY